MDSHIATQIRRAKRSKSTALDLSHLGLPDQTGWCPALFELSQLQSLKLNNNELATVPSELCRLESLSVLDVSYNKIEKLPTLDFDKLLSLGSINLEGNPVAKDLPANMVQQLSHPNVVPGKSQAQVLRDLLREASKGTSSSGANSEPRKPPVSNHGVAASAQSAAMPKPFAAAPAQERKASGEKSSFADYMKDLGGSDEEYPDDFDNSDDDGPKPSRLAADVRGPAGKQEAAVPHGVSAFRAGSDSDDTKPSWQVEGSRVASGKRETAVRALPTDDQPIYRASGTTTSDRRTAAAGTESAQNATAEIAKLKAQVKDLKAQLARSEKPAESVPKVDLARTLPSRLHAFDEDDAAAKLKQQLQDEQRKTKRLERDNQKLQDRMRESSMSLGGSAAPHIELSEVQQGDILSNSGGFSLIYKGTWHGTPVAIKNLFDPSNSAENLAEMDNEVDKLAKLRHPNILSLLAVHRKPPAFSIIMEVVTGGSLYQLLHSKRSFNIDACSRMPVQQPELIKINEYIALALSFMHARNITHRDVKSHNVLLSPHLEVKLCDFGLARMKSELMTGAMQFAGTPQYLSPELYRKQKYTEKVDVFAFGTILWECMAEDIPFANLDVPEIAELVMSGKMLVIPRSAPRPIQALIKSCWTLEPNVRPAMADVLDKIRAPMS